MSTINDLQCFFREANGWLALKRKLVRALGSLGDGYCEASIDDDTRYGFEANTAMVYTSCGKAWLRRGQLNLAIKQLTKAIELDPDSAVAYLNRGMARQAKGDREGGEADFARARELKLSSDS